MSIEVTDLLGSWSCVVEGGNWGLDVPGRFEGVAAGFGPPVVF